MLALFNLGLVEMIVLGIIGLGALVVVAGVIFLALGGGRKDRDS